MYKFFTTVVPTLLLSLYCSGLAFAQTSLIDPPVDMTAMVTDAGEAYGGYMSPVVALAIGVVVVLSIAALIFWALKRK